MLLPKRKKYSCTTTKQDKSLVQSPNLVKDMVIELIGRPLEEWKSADVIVIFLRWLDFGVKHIMGKF